MFLQQQGIISGGAAGYGDDFVFEITTASASETVTIPARDTGTYNATVSWGDGEPDSTITTYNDADLTHEYADAGAYEVKISGTFPHLFINDWGTLKTRITEVKNWGDVGFNSLWSTFNGCTNLTITAEDSLDCTGMTLFQSAFKSCPSITSFDFGWFTNTSSVTSFFEFVSGCSGIATFSNVSGFDTSSAIQMGSAFKGIGTMPALDIGSWNITKMTAAPSMFFLSTLSTSDYDSLLIGWEGQTEQTSVAFHGGSSTYSTGAATTARGVLTDTSLWTIIDGGQA